MHKSQKHLSRKTKKYNSRKKSRQNKNQTNQTHKSKNKSKSKSKGKGKKNNSKKYNISSRMQRQKGGFTNCNLASVKEPGFNIAGLGDIPGLSIPDSRGAIYRPNCKPDTYQAMTP
jgi:hypothetical protein